MAKLTEAQFKALEAADRNGGEFYTWRENVHTGTVKALVGPGLIEQDDNTFTCYLLTDAGRAALAAERERRAAPASAPADTPCNCGHAAICTRDQNCAHWASPPDFEDPHPELWDTPAPVDAGADGTILCACCYRNVTRSGSFCENCQAFIDGLQHVHEQKIATLQAENAALVAEVKRLREALRQIHNNAPRRAPMKHEGLLNHEQSYSFWEAGKLAYKALTGE